MIKNLPREQVEILEKAYRKAKRVKEKQRLQALLLLRGGYKRKEVQNIIRISKQTLGDWITRYNKYGLKGLADKPQPGNHHILTKDQKQTIQTLITSKTPEELGYKDKFWDLDKLKQLIKDRFNLTYRSNTSYRKMFHLSGFSFHKPDKVNKKQNKQTIKNWEENIKKDWRGTAKKMGWYW
jgi:transposase